MALPIRTTVDDIQDVCGYLAKKPTGATMKDAKSVLDPKRLDGRKLSALRHWGLITEEEDKMKLTEEGRRFTKGEHTDVLGNVIREVKPYSAIVERAHHRAENSLTATEVAAHWHDHFSTDAAGSEKTLNDQAVCFFQVAQGAGLGTMVVGRKGSPTRFDFRSDAVEAFADGESASPATDTDPPLNGSSTDGALSQQLNLGDAHAPHDSGQHTLGKGIFIAHGKNKKPLLQLKGILDQFKVPYMVAEDEPNLGRPISEKVRETMRACNCAILIFTADEEFKDKGGNTIWRPSENVVHELGAAGYLYGKQIVIMKEEDVTLPSNFSDLGYISFEKNQLEAKAMHVMKELVGFEIVKFST